jgi:hypothetical protein
MLLRNIVGISGLLTFLALLVHRIANYRTMGCEPPIEIWFAGLWALLACPFLFVVILTNSVKVKRASALALLAPILLLVASLILWNFIGFIWVDEDFYFEKPCLSTSFSAKLKTFQIFFTILNSTLLLFSREIYFELKAKLKIKRQQLVLGVQLLRIYKNIKEVPSGHIAKFVQKYKNVLGKVRLLKIEKIIIRREFTKVVEQALEGKECSICLGGFEVGHLHSSIGCSHEFHYDCIINWLEMKPCCPMCIAPIRARLLESYKAKMQGPIIID